MMIARLHLVSVGAAWDQAGSSSNFNVSILAKERQEDTGQSTDRWDCNQRLMECTTSRTGHQLNPRMGLHVSQCRETHFGTKLTHHRSTKPYSRCPILIVQFDLLPILL